ncbi:hypothetical protein B2J93_9520 [Marssonina coronariae]|uniref:Uncharacterized protein n=1 Tax=Diplocarpon coronariae TaxID=2795749 RepID=A0A218ZGR3_9HELO|nr:hypothetical protein B2J93_9520 [Marssonina coronariae]
MARRLPHGRNKQTHVPAPGQLLTGQRQHSAGLFRADASSVVSIRPRKTSANRGGVSSHIASSSKPVRHQSDARRFQTCRDRAPSGIALAARMYEEAFDSLTFGPVLLRLSEKSMLAPDKPEETHLILHANGLLHLKSQRNEGGRASPAECDISVVGGGSM